MYQGDMAHSCFDNKMSVNLEQFTLQVTIGISSLNFEYLGLFWKKMNPCQGTMGPAPSWICLCIHYKLGVGLAYVQGEAYDGLEVLTPARVVDGGVL